MTLTTQHVIPLWLLVSLSLLQAAPAAAEGMDLVNVSGDIRQRATYVSAIDFDDNNPETGWFWTQRIRVNADMGAVDGVHGRISLYSGIQEGIEQSPVHDNHLDIQEAYITLPVAEAELTLGRQEIALGSQRLVGTRDGTNVRRNWEGMRLVTPLADWNVQAIALQLVQVDSDGAFNDESTSGRQLAGVYATKMLPWTGLDVYYLYARFKDRETIEGVADEQRQSLGMRIFGESGSVFWNWEAVAQGGTFGGKTIRAWTLASNTGVRLPGSWNPELTLSTNVASGDKNPGDGRLETFNALYPRGNYFSDLAQLAPANFFNLNPYLTLQPREDVFISLDVNFYWRLQKDDGIYSPPSNLLRTPGGSRERFVNTAVSLSVEWELNPRWLLALSLTHSQPEEFISETGPSDTANFGEFTVLARF
ncbi:MAG: alginate export family protein [Pseudomonadota bacterium]